MQQLAEPVEPTAIITPSVAVQRALRAYDIAAWLLMAVGTTSLATPFGQLLYQLDSATTERPNSWPNCWLV